ncbi:ribonuclease-like 3 [Pimephales promelas]|uniref:ribonuclease-like 3 n=1 Tax=Pimephales promelas TaxID=90988 RepID=UPI0019554FC3|nr:ribonuclease-like 3 [Pimephales promelas]XP_039538756.1 ribonuclease-like 3 [Pimephales promelas]
MEIHQSAVILLLVVCVSFSTHAQPADIMRRYQKFLNQHLGPDMNVQKCDSEMRTRNITGTDGGCKPVNTFIQANENQLKAVCDKRNQLNKDRNLFKSGQQFPVVTCRFKPGLTPPNCEYRRGRLSTRYIVLGCVGGWPVHYNNTKTIQYF